MDVVRQAEKLISATDIISTQFFLTLPYLLSQSNSFKESDEYSKQRDSTMAWDGKDSESDFYNFSLKE